MGDSKCAFDDCRKPPRRDSSYCWWHAVIKKREEMLAAPIASAGAFGCSLPLATLRLLSFHPIQSALSNSLRTGKATLSLKERVTCIEARRYGVLMGEVGELESAMTEWLKIAFAVRSQEATGNARADAIRAEGMQLLKTRRSQSLARPREELADAFARVERALMALAKTLGNFRAAASGRAGRGGDLDAGFDGRRPVSELQEPVSASSTGALDSPLEDPSQDDAS